MKMKKLLSIGVLGLVVACSTSIGASAAVTVSDTDKILLKLIATQYNDGENQTDLLAGINKNSKLSDILNDNFTKTLKTEFPDSENINKALTKFEDNKNLTVEEALAKVSIDEATFIKFQSDFKLIAQEIQEMDNLKGNPRADKEKAVMRLFTAYNPKLSVTFGKDSAGLTTASINENNKILIQINSDNLQTIINRVEGLEWKDIQIIKDAANLAGIFK